MTSRVTDIIVDCRQPEALARWWAETSGYHLVNDGGKDWVAIAPWPRSEDAPGEEAFRVGPQLPRIVFVPVPEAKSAKNRMHLDIWPVDRTSEEEVQHLLDRGASRLDLGQGEVQWEVMADPEGNEFCVMR